MWLFLVLSSFLKIGNSSSDADRCITKGVENSEVFQTQYCMATRRDVIVSCPQHEMVVLTALKFAVKRNRDICTKRVLQSRDLFCCTTQESDIIYDGHCLKDIWNAEDYAHYQQFINKVLTKCTNSSECVINAKMFSSLQRRIPNTKKYSSYVQVLHQCIKAPMASISLCSSTSVKGKQVLIKESSNHGVDNNSTCECLLKSHSGAIVTTEAIDVRVTHNKINLISDGKASSISSNQSTLFGLRKVAVGRKIRISVDRFGTHTNEHIRLLVAGSDGRSVYVACGESPYVVEKTSEQEEPIPNVINDASNGSTRGVSVFMGYWPLIYIAVGSVFTIVILACIGCTFIMCRSNRREGKNSHSQHRCGHPTFPCPPECQPDFYGPPYATVLEDRLGSLSSRATENDPANSSTRNNQGINPPRCPGISERCPGISYSRVDAAPGLNYDVSQLEAFLKSKESK